MDMFDDFESMFSAALEALLDGEVTESVHLLRNLADCVEEEGRIDPEEVAQIMENVLEM